MGPPEHPNLRGWRDEDLAPFVAMNADPEVGYWIGGPWSEEKSRSAFEGGRVPREDGLGTWPIVDAEGRFVGACGLIHTRADLALAPAVEAIWRLMPMAWGRGLVTSAMRPILARGFAEGDLDRIIAMTARSNLRSQAVMRRLGFTPTPERDFDHPALAAGHPLRPHVTYALPRGAAPC